MGDIILTNELALTPPVKTVKNYSWSITPEEIIANLNYFASDGTTIVCQETFHITGADYQPLKDSIITSGVVGQKYLTVIETAIRNKIKTMKGWTGTVP
jgi:hypothetical protein